MKLRFWRKKRVCPWCFAAAADAAVAPCETHYPAVAMLYRDDIKLEPGSLVSTPDPKRYPMPAWLSVR